MSDNCDGIKYESFEAMPPETPISLTELWTNNGRYVDYGKGMYCSPEGVNSTRRPRAELWAIRHQTRPDHPGATRFYCRDDLPSREWVAGQAQRRLWVNEVSCTECFMLMPAGSICETTGLPHAPAER